MIVPDYWAEARRQHRTRSKQVTVRRFGWSNVSEADAVVMAEQRADEALARIVAGEKLRRREPRVGYNGAEGVPIREEVLERHGPEVITRNAYGAECLNSPRALFVDVDDVAGGIGTRVTVAGMVAAIVAPLVVAGATGGRPWWGALAAIVVVAFVFYWLTNVIVTLRGGEQRIIHGRLAKFVSTHREWNVRLYRTPNGFRMLATHTSFDARSSETTAFFRAMGADRTYVRMCHNQNCFRARLTGKPWRMGIDQHIRPRRGAWPIADEQRDERNQWVREYEERSRGFAACEFVEEIGSGQLASSLRSVVELHDRRCRALEPGLPMA